VHHRFLRSALVVLICCLSACGGNSVSNVTNLPERSIDLEQMMKLYKKTGERKPGPQHGDSLVGDLKYPADFSHVDYVNPDAPIGGMLTLSSFVKFDNYNPYIIKGIALNFFLGDFGMFFETLMTNTLDEPASQYSLIADSIEYPIDKSSVSFTINPAARWHDGQPVTVEDVIYSFNILTTKGAPRYSQYYADVVKAEKTGDRRVTFTFKPRSNPELPNIMSQLPVIPKHFFQNRNFEEPLRDIPPGSGPYRIGEVDMGKSITLVRDQGYWGWKLPIRRGHFNFEKIRFIVYLDPEVMFRGFKAGEYDFNYENSAKRWATEYQGTMFDNGTIVRDLIPDDTPHGMQSFFYNLRKDIFRDAKVREAISYAFDFEWLRSNIFYNQYNRSRSVYGNSVFAACLAGLPSDAEKKLLAPLKDKVPSQVFTEVYQPPKSNGTGTNRENLKIATEILKQSGWAITDGKLVNKATGKPMTIEIIDEEKSSERYVGPLIDNLKKLGIDASFRVIDRDQMVERLRKFDYDMIMGSISESFSPGNEQRYFWGSQAADQPGSNNYAGIKDPAVDSLIESIVSAKNTDELITACRALDRVLLWNHYFILQWDLSYYRIAYKSTLQKPDVKVPLFSAGPYVCLSTWWQKP
jgi:microcin C transport system substrate-binding protein